MRTVSLLVAAGLAVFLVSGCASRSALKTGKHAEGHVVEAEGLAPFDGTDLIAAKQSSLRDAQRKAVERVVGVYLSARTLVDKAMVVEDNILSRTEGYVRRYDIMKEGASDGFYRTRIRALVALKDLEADLGNLALLDAPLSEKPAVSVVLVEMVGREAAPGRAAAAALEARLLEQGYRIFSGDDEAGADLAVAGKAAAFPFQSNLGGFVSYRARLDVQVAQPGARETLAAMTKEASGLGGNEELAALKALESVGALVGEELAGTLAGAWARKRTLVVVVENLAAFSDLESLQRHMAAQPGVSAVALRSFEEGLARFEVGTQENDPVSFASRLEKIANVSLRVVETAPGLIRLRVR